MTTIEQATKALVDLLINMFTESTLRSFVHFGPDGEMIGSEISDNAALHAIADIAVTEWKKRDLISLQWDLLLQARPGRKPDIEATRALFQAAAAPGISRLKAALRARFEVLPPLLREFRIESDFKELTVEERIQGELLDRPATDASRAAPQSPTSTADTRKLLDLLEHPQRHWVLLGAPGSGKTIALRRLALTLLDGGKLPLLFTVRDLERGLGELLAQIHPDGVSAFEQAVEANDAVLLLDNLEQAPRNGLLELQNMRSRYDQLPIIVATRPAAFSPPHGYQSVQLCPLDEERRRTLLENLLPRSRHHQIPDLLRQLLTMRGIRELSQNPLALTLVALPFNEGAERRVDLCAATVQWLFTRAHDKQALNPLRGGESWMGAAGALGWLALRTQLVEGGNSYEVDEMLVQMQEAPVKVRAIIDAEGGLRSFLEHCAFGAGLLAGDHHDPRLVTAWSFTPRMLGEYMMALAFKTLSDENEKQRIVDAAVHTPGMWAETLALVTGLITDDDEFVTSLAERGGKAHPLVLWMLGDAPTLSERTLELILRQQTGRVTEDYDLAADCRRQVLERSPRVLPYASDSVTFATRHASRVSRELSEHNGRYHGGDLWLAASVCQAVADAAASEDERAYARHAAGAIFADHRPDERDRVLKALEIQWVRVPAGTHVVGSGEPDAGWAELEARHRVELLKDLTMQSVEVTNSLYEAFDPAHAAERLFDNVPDAAEHPVANVTWWEAAAFAAWLSAGCDGTLRLPTEVEWEIAAGGRTDSPNASDTEAELSKVAWYAANSDGRLHAVSRKHPNARGLHDMHGSVWEWCADAWDEDRYRSQAAGPQPFPHDPTGTAMSWVPGLWRSKRGGCYRDGVNRLRTSYRLRSPPHFRGSVAGLRLVRTQTL